MERWRRMERLGDTQRGELLRRAHDLWVAVGGAIGTLERDCADARTLVWLRPQLDRFAEAVGCDGASFGAAASGTVPPWRDEADRFETDVDEAIAACGGCERATIRSLLVLTDFLELEAFGTAGVRYRKERLAR